MDPILLYRGEKRFLSAELAASLATGATLSGTPSVTIVAKRGRSATEILTNDPDAPAVDSDTEVRFWVDVPADQARGNYLAIVTCGTTNDEEVVEEVPLIVQ